MARKVPLGVQFIFEMWFEVVPWCLFYLREVEFVVTCDPPEQINYNG